MTTPDFRALCAELANELQGYKTAHPMHDRSLLIRARAALATAPQGAVAWMYPGEPTFDGDKWKEKWEVTLNYQVAKFKAAPGEPIPLYTANSQTEQGEE